MIWAEGMDIPPGAPSIEEARVAGRKELRRPPGSRRRGPWVLEVELGSGLWSLFILLIASVLSAAVSDGLVPAPRTLHSGADQEHLAGLRIREPQLLPWQPPPTCPMALCQAHMQFLCLQAGARVFPLPEFPAPLPGFYQMERNAGCLASNVPSFL